MATDLKLRMELNWDKVSTSIVPSNCDACHYNYDSESNLLIVETPLVMTVKVPLTFRSIEETDDDTIRITGEQLVNAKEALKL